MSKAQTIKLIKGVSQDEDLAEDGFMASIIAVDINGTGGGTSTSAPHRRDVYQPTQRMVAEAETAATNNVTDSIEWIYPYNAKTYGISNGARLYEASTAFGGTWGLKFATSASTGGAGLLPFGTNLYYGQDTVLGKYNGSASNHNFQTFNSSTAGPRPMAVIAGRLAVGNQRNVATLDSDETTFNATRLQLPTGYVVRSLELWNNFLAIAADFTPTSATNPISSRLFLWNGTAASYTDSLELPFTSAPMLIANNNLLWIIGSDTASNMVIYAFNGSVLQQAYFYPNTIPHGIGSRTRFQGNILFGTNGRTPSANGGVWMIGNGDDQIQPMLSLMFLNSPASTTGTNVAGLYGEANDLLAAWYDGTNYGMDQTSNAVFPTTGAQMDTLPLHMGAPVNKKTFYEIRVDLEDPGSSTSATFEIQYKLDLATSWTSLKTITQAGGNFSVNVPIIKTAKRIEFRFKWVVSGSNNPLRLRSWSVYYEIQPQ